MMEKLKRPKEEEKEEDEEIGELFMGIMKGYKDSVIPALSELKFVGGIENCEKGSINFGKKARVEASETESFKKERFRREKMTEKFDLLQSMVPSLISNPKVSREKIVTETIGYVRNLEKEIEKLEEMKRSKHQIEPVLCGCNSYLKPYVTTTVLNGIAFFGIQLQVKMGSICKIFEIFHKYHAEVFELTILVIDQRVLTLTGTLTVGVDGKNVVEKIKEEILVL